MNDTPRTTAATLTVAMLEGEQVKMVPVVVSEELERERDAARRMWSIHQDKLAALREQVRLTIMENLHLADGDVCTLKRLKDAIGFDLDSPENAEQSRDDGENLTP